MLKKRVSELLDATVLPEMTILVTLPADRLHDFS